MLSRHERTSCTRSSSGSSPPNQHWSTRCERAGQGPLRRIPTALLVITDIVAFALLILAFTGTSAVLILLSLLVTSCAVCLHVARHAVP